MLTEIAFWEASGRPPQDEVKERGPILTFVQTLRTGGLDLKLRQHFNDTKIKLFHSEIFYNS